MENCDRKENSTNETDTKETGMEKSRGSASRHSAGVWQSAGVWLSGACTGGTEDTGYEQDATCTCGELCAEDHLNADCPVCGKHPVITKAELAEQPVCAVKE